MNQDSDSDSLPYFHAHDQYNYGWWRPLYVADMLELQSRNPVTWKFLNDGNFAITIHDIEYFMDLYKT